MKKKVQHKDKSVAFKRIFLGLVFLFLFKEWIIYFPILNFFETRQTKPIIIDEKNGLRRSNFTGDFVYSYSFIYNGKEYKNESDNQKFHVGEKLIVEFNPTFPFMNRIYKSRFSK